MADKRNSSNNWFMNVGKSLGYGVKDFGAKLTPEMTGIYDNNAGYVAGQIDKLKKSGGFKTGLSNPIKNNKQLAIGKEALANALSDIKSGKIYNKEREMKVTDAVNEEGMSGFGDGFNFEDFDDIGIDDKEESYSGGDDEYSGDPAARIAIKQSTIEVTDSIRATARTVKNSTDRMVANGNLNTSAIITSVGRALSPLNDHVSNLVVSVNNIETFQLNDVKKSIQETANYQRTTIDLLTQQNENLKKLVQRFPVHVGGEDEERGKSQFQRVFGGGFSIEEYSKVMKENINEAIDGSGLGQIRQILGSTDDLKIMAANPIGFIATKAVEKAVPLFVQQSIKQIDKSFSEFIPSLFMRISREGDKRGGVMGILSSLFGIRSSTTGTVNLGKFEKGPIPFDGETKKAITEVIPGYLRKMLAVLSKQDEISFDYNDGKWKYSKDIAKKFKEDREEQMMSGSRFGRTRSDIMRIADNVVDMDSFERKEFEKNITKFFTKQVETGYGINYANRNELLEALSHFNNESSKQLAAEILQTAMKDSHMTMAGSGIMKGRDAENKFMAEAEKNPLMSGASTYGNGLLELGNTTTKLDEAVVKLGTNIAGSDKFGMTTHDYLRDMKTILLNGIRVYPQAISGLSGTGGSSNPNASMIEDMKLQTAEYDNLVSEKLLERQKERYSREKKAELREKGSLLLEDINESNVSMIGPKAKAFRNAQLKSRDSDGEKKESAVSKFIKQLKSGDSASRVFEEQMRDMLSKPSRFLLERFNKFDEWMYNMVFPDPNKSGNKSFIVGIADKITDTFSGVKDFIIKDIFSPMKDMFFGENGFMKKENDSLKGLSDFFLGKREWTPDGNGKRVGGVFAGMIESTQDMKDKFVYMLNGRAYTDNQGVKYEFKEDALLPSLNSSLKKVRDGVTKYLMGDKDAERDVDKKGILSTVVDTLKTGANNWKEALFGPSSKPENSKRTTKEVLQQALSNLPKTAAVVGLGGLAGTLLASGTGILGAIALPGAIGPILGMSVAMGTRSETLMNKMFGEKDINGDRIGAIINRNTQEFFKKNKNVIIGGGALGFLKGALGIGIGGIVGNAILGPVGMAGIGVAAAMAYRSNRVQDMLFGKMDDDTGERIGGLLNRKGKDMTVGGKRMKDFIPNALVGSIGGAGLGGAATYGLLGGLFGPAGLIGGALLGAAGGIALSSDKFKAMIFGKYDEKTGLKEGGVVGKFTNWFNVEIKNKLSTEIQQVKLNMKKWFNRSVAQPLERAIDPMKKAFQNMVDSTQALFKNSWEVIKTNVSTVFKDYVGAPFGAFMNKFIMGPLKKVMKGVVYGGGSLLGGAISLPFKAAGAVGDGLSKRHMRRGVTKYRESIRNDENLSWAQKIGAMYFDRDAIKAARYSEDGADYLKDQEERNKRNEEREKGWSEEQARIDKMRDRTNKASRLAMKYGYDSMIEVPDPSNPGKTKKIDLARLINISFDKGGKNYRKFMNGEGAKDEYREGIEQTLGVPLQMLLGQEYDATIDPSKLSSNQRKLVSRAFKKSKGTLKGNALLRALGIKGDVRKFEEDRQAIIDKKKAESEKKEEKDSATERLKAQIESVKSLESTSIDNTDRIINAIKGLNLDTPSSTKKDTSGDFVDFKPIVELDIQHFADKKEGDVKAEVKKPETNIKTPIDILLERTISMDKHLRVIAQNVEGQLDGVGSNVYKTRKILQEQAGISDDDLTGSSNRDRLGWWGRFKQMLYRPFEKIGETISTYVVVVKEKIKNVVANIIKPFTWMKDKIIQVGGAMLNGAKAIVSTIGTIGKTILIDLPKGLASIVKEGSIKLIGAIATVGETVVNVAGTILRGAGDILAGTATGIKNILVGAGKGIGSIIKGVSTGIGKIFSGVGSLVGGVAKRLGDVVVGTIDAVKPTIKAIVTGVGKVASTVVELPFRIMHGAVDIANKTVTAITKFTASAIKTVGELAIDIKDGIVAGLKTIGKTALSIVSAPFKAIGAAWRSVTSLGKPQRVEVVGGYLDYIGAKKSTVKSEGWTGPNGDLAINLDNLQFFGADKPKEEGDDSIAKGLSLTSVDSLQIKNPNTAIKQGKYRNLYKTLRLTWTKDRPLPVYLVESKDKTTGESTPSTSVNNTNGVDGTAGGSESGSGNPISAAKNIYKGGRMGVAGTVGLYSASKNAIKNRQNGVSAWKGFAGAYMGSYNKVNGTKDSKANAATQVGSSAVSTPGVLSRGKNRSSTFMSGGFNINKANGGNYDSQASFTSRKNIGYYLDNLAQRQEMEEKSMFRYSTVDLLSKIEYNTRKTWELLQELNGSLPKAMKDLGALIGKGLDKLDRTLGEVIKAVSDKDPSDDPDTINDDGGDDIGGEDNSNRIMSTPVRPGTTAGGTKGAALMSPAHSNTVIGTGARDRGGRLKALPTGIVAGIPSPKSTPVAIGASRPSAAGKQIPTSNRLASGPQPLLLGMSGQPLGGPSDEDDKKSKRSVKDKVFGKRYENDNDKFAMEKFNQQNAKWRGLNDTSYIDESKPDYDRYGYQAKTANGMYINPDGTLSEKPGKTTKDIKPKGVLSKTVGGIGKGSGRLLSGIARGGVGIAGIVGATWLATSLLNDGPEATWGKVKNAGATGYDKIVDYLGKGKTDEEKAKFKEDMTDKKDKVVGAVTDAKDYVTDKAGWFGGRVKDKWNKTKNYWKRAGESDGEEGFSFHDFLWGLSDMDSKNPLVNSKLGQAMIGKWDAGKEWLNKMGEDYDKEEGMFKHLDKIRDAYDGIKNYFADTSEGLGGVWNGIKNMDMGEVWDAVSGSGLLQVLGAGLGAMGIGAGIKVRNMRAASKLRNKEMAARDREDNLYGLDTRTHIRGRAKRRTMTQVFKDAKRNDFGLTKTGRANNRDEAAYRRKDRRDARRDLHRYDDMIRRGDDTRDLDSKYAASGLMDHNGRAIDDPRYRGAPVIRNGRIVGYNLRSDVDMSADALRGYGSRVGNDRFDGQQVRIQEDPRYTTGNVLQRSWAKYAPHNAGKYMRYKREQEDSIKHLANLNGEDIRRKRRTGTIVGGLAAGALMTTPLGWIGAPLALGGGLLFGRNKDGNVRAADMYNRARENHQNREYYQDFRHDRDYVHGASTRSMHETFTGRPDAYDPNFYYWSHMNNAYANDPRFQNLSPNEYQQARVHGFENDTRSFGDMMNPANNPDDPNGQQRVNRATRDELLGKNERNPFKRLRKSVFWETTKDMIKGRRDGGFLNTYNRNKNLRFEEEGLDREERFSTRMKDKFKNSSVIKGFSKWKENRNNNGIVNKGFFGYWGDEVKNKRQERRDREVREAREAYREQERNNFRYSSPIGPQMNPLQDAANRRNAVPNLLINMPTGPVAPRDNNPINPNRNGNPNLLFNNFDNQFFAGRQPQPMITPYGPMYQQPVSPMPMNQPQVRPTFSQPGFSGDLDSIGQFHGPQTEADNEARRRENMTDAERQAERNARKTSSRTTISDASGGDTSSINTRRVVNGGDDTTEQSRTRRVAGNVARNTGRAGKAAGKGIGTVAKLGGKLVGGGANLLGKGGGKVGKVAGMLGKNALRVGGAALGGIGLAAGAAMGAKNGVERTDEIFGIKEGEKATGGQKKAAGVAGGVVGAIPFADMLDEALGGKITKWIANVSLDAMEGFENIKKKLSKGWDTVKDKIGGPLKSITNKTKEVWDGLKESVSKGWKGLKKFVSDPIKTIKDSTSKVWKGLKSTVSKGWNKVKSLVSKPINAVKNATSKVWSNIKSSVSKGWDKVKSLVSKPINKMKSNTTKLWNKIKSIISKAWDKIRSSITKPINKIKNKTTSLWNKVKDTITKAWDKVKTKITDVTKAVYTKTKEKFEAVKKAVVDKFTQVRDTIKDKVTGMYDTVKDKITTAYNTIKDKFNTIKDTLTSKVEEIKNSILDPIKDAASIVADKFAGFKAKAESLLSNLNPANWGSGYGSGNNKEAKKYGAGPNLYKEHLKGSGNKYGAGPLDNDGAYYSQNDARWANQPLANQSGSVKFGDAGCGPTAAAMLVSSVKSQTGNGFSNLPQTGAGYGGKFGAGYGKGVDENPQQVANVNTPDEPVKALKFAQQGGFVDPKRGTRDDFFSAYGMSNNIAMSKQEKPTGEFLKKQLAAGNKMVIRGVGGRNFTDAGHYVVATGVDSSGKIKVKDPISASRSGKFSAESLAKNATDAYVANVGKAEFGSGENDGIHYNPYVGSMARNILEGRDIFDMGSGLNENQAIKNGDYMEGDDEAYGNMTNAEIAKSMMTGLDDDAILGSGNNKFGLGYKFTAEQAVSFIYSLPFGVTTPGKRGYYRQIRCNHGTKDAWDCDKEWDCSGLVLKVARKFKGRYPGQTAAEQYRDCKKIKSKDLRMGDLVFFTNGGGPGKVSHVGIVTGVRNGHLLVTHTSNSRTGMRKDHEITPYWTFYKNMFAFGRLRDMKPGRKLTYKHKPGIYGDRKAKDDTYKDDGKHDPINSSKSTTGKTKTETIKKLISKDPFEKFNLMITAGAASVLQGKRLGVKGLKDALYTTEKVTKYVPGKTTSSSNKKDSKKDKATGSSSRRVSGNVKQTDTVLTAPVKPKFKAKGVYNGNGKSSSYLVDHDLRIQDSTVTGKDINAWFERKSGWRKKSAMRNNGNAFIAGAASAGIDPRYLAAHAALESEWGDSRIARLKHNFFGIGAVDHAPFEKAYKFKDPIDGMVAGGQWIAKNYPHGKYGQTTLRKMRFKTSDHQYATDRYWHTKIANTMTGIKGTAKFKKAAGNPKGAKYGAGNISATTPKAKVNYGAGPKTSGKGYTIHEQSTYPAVPKGMKVVSSRNGSPSISVRSNSTPKVTYGSGGMTSSDIIRDHEYVFAKGGDTKVYHVENKTDVKEQSSITDDMLNVLKEIATYTKETAENVLSISLPGANGNNVVVSAGGNGGSSYTPSSAQAKARAASSDRK